MSDVVIVGGGPAGCTTARRLAAQGHRVVVLEEHRETGLPVHCTGLLGLEAFEEFDLPRDTILGRASSARFWGADRTSVAVGTARVQAAVIDRALFDQRLAQVAEAAGADVRRDWRVERIEVRSDSVVVADAGNRTVQARALVLACGANYRFHRALELGVPRAYMQSAQLETPFPVAPQVQVRLGREVAPGGFGWLVSFEREGASYARIGLMCETEGGEYFDAFASRLCEEAGVDPKSLPEPRRKLLPLAPVSRTFGHRVLAIGDAAGLVKPTTGGGIYYGIISGSLAADVLGAALESDRLGAPDLRKYEKLWRRRLGSEIRVSLAFRRLAERFDDRAINDLIQLARVNGVVPLLQETASFNWHRKAVVSLLGHSAFRSIVMRALCA
ncbi:MAG: NAD(P)/FAD-dependent oxidoreductase [Vicinamibacterales bacterium]